MREIKNEMTKMPNEKTLRSGCQAAVHPSPRPSPLRRERECHAQRLHTGRLRVNGAGGLRQWWFDRGAWFIASTDRVRLRRCCGRLDGVPPTGLDDTARV